MRAQLDGKLRLRSTPCAFCRVPRRHPSGLRLGTATISVPPARRPRSAGSRSRVPRTRSRGCSRRRAHDARRRACRARRRDARARRPSARSAAPQASTARRRITTRRPQHGELVGDRELAAAEAEERGGTSAAAARLAALARRLEHVAAQQHALEVRRRHVVTESRGVEVAQLRDRERLGCEREAGVRVRELRAQALASGEHDRAVVERGGREAVDGMPRGVVGEPGIGVGRHEPEVRRRELPLVRGRGRARSACRAARDARARGRRPSRRGGGGSSPRASRPASR